MFKWLKVQKYFSDFFWFFHFFQSFTHGVDKQWKRGVQTNQNSVSLITNFVIVKNQTDLWEKYITKIRQHDNKCGGVATQMLLHIVYIFRYKREFGFVIENRDIIVDDIIVRGTAKSQVPQSKEMPLTNTEAPLEKVNLIWVVTAKLTSSCLFQIYDFFITDYTGAEKKLGTGWFFLNCHPGILKRSFNAFWMTYLFPYSVIFDWKCNICPNLLNFGGGRCIPLPPENKVFVEICTRKIRLDKK